MTTASQPSCGRMQPTMHPARGPHTQCSYVRPGGGRAGMPVDFPRRIRRGAGAGGTCLSRRGRGVVRKQHHTARCPPELRLSRQKSLRGVAGAAGAVAVGCGAGGAPVPACRRGLGRCRTVRYVYTEEERTAAKACGKTVVGACRRRQRCTCTHARRAG
jgi:hypothetical protein